MHSSIFLKLVYHIIQIWFSLFKILFDWCIFITFTFILNVCIMKRVISFLWFIMVYGIFFSINLVYRFWPFYRLKHLFRLVLFLMFTNHILFQAIYFVFIQNLINLIFSFRVLVVIAWCRTQYWTYFPSHSYFATDFTNL